MRDLSLSKFTKRDPNERDVRDAEALEFIRRATLDSIWSREPATVKKNLQGLLRSEGTMIRLNLPPMLDFLGPFPLEDIHGMQAAIAVRDRSLDKGLYKSHNLQIGQNARQRKRACKSFSLVVFYRNSP